MHFFSKSSIFVNKNVLFFLKNYFKIFKNVVQLICKKKKKKGVNIMKDRFLSKNLEDATKRLEMFKNKLSLITDSNNEKIKSREQTFKHIMLIYNIEKYLYSLKGIKMRKQQIKYKKLVQSYFLKRNDYDKLKNAFDKYL